MSAQTARKLNNSGFQTMHLHHVQNAPGWVHRLKSTDLNRLHCIHFGRATDPCMGSGHILVYLFDVLMQIYESYGYTQRDAAKLVVQKNLYGLDIDKRAYQLSYFAVMMKARQYNRRILNGELTPNLFAIQNSSALTPDLIDFIANGDKTLKSALQSIKDDLKDATEYGSILNVNAVNFERLYARMEEIESTFYDNIIGQMNQKLCKDIALPIIRQAEAMEQKYVVVCTNPPYMGAKSMSSRLQNYVQHHFPASKFDLFSAFIEKGISMCTPNGFSCMVTMQSWMFLISFEDMRKNILSNYCLDNLMHMGNMVMGIAFGTSVSVIRKQHIPCFNARFSYVNIKDIKDEIPEVFPTKSRRNVCSIVDSFSNIPAMPIAYWAGEKMISHFISENPLGNVCELKQGLITADNARFLRYWNEVDFNKFVPRSVSIEEFSRKNGKWLPYNKGGEYRKWYGNNDLAVNWENDGFEIRNFRNEKGKLLSRPQNIQYFGREGASWSIITNGNFSLRYTPMGFGFDARGSMAFSKDVSIFYVLALMNSNVAKSYLDFLSPTVSFEVGNVGKVPLIRNMHCENNIIDLAKQNVELSKLDWDAFETSWDFKLHPLMRSVPTIAEAYAAWSAECDIRFSQLKANEELPVYYKQMTGVD